MIISKHAEISMEVEPSSEGAYIILCHYGPNDSWEHRFIIDPENLSNLKDAVDTVIERRAEIWGEDNVDD